jgi:hypothetical protein
VRERRVPAVDQGGVEVARPQTFEVERDVAVAGAAYGGDDVFAPVQHASQIIQR